MKQGISSFLNGTTDSGPQFEVCIYEEEYRQIENWVLQKPNIETGGDLFGLWIDKHRAVVQFVLGPGKECRRSTSSFYQDVSYLNHVGGYLVENQGLCNIGQWHSHHRLNLKEPSNGDLQTVWGNLPKLNLDSYIVFIATVEDSWKGETSVDVNCFLFELDTMTGSQLPVLRGKFNKLKNNSPMRLNFEVYKRTLLGGESINEIFIAPDEKITLVKQNAIVNSTNGRHSRRDSESKTNGFPFAKKRGVECEESEGYWIELQEKGDFNKVEQVFQRSTEPKLMISGENGMADEEVKNIRERTLRDQDNRETSPEGNGVASSVMGGVPMAVSMDGDNNPCNNQKDGPRSDTKRKIGDGDREKLDMLRGNGKEIKVESINPIVRNIKTVDENADVTEVSLGEEDSFGYGSQKEECEAENEVQKGTGTDKTEKTDACAEISGDVNESRNEKPKINTSVNEEKQNCETKSANKDETDADKVSKTYASSESIEKVNESANKTFVKSKSTENDWEKNSIPGIENKEETGTDEFVTVEATEEETGIFSGNVNEPFNDSRGTANQNKMEDCEALDGHYEENYANEMEAMDPSGNVHKTLSENESAADQDMTKGCETGKQHKEETDADNPTHKTEAMADSIVNLNGNDDETKDLLRKINSTKCKDVEETGIIENEGTNEVSGSTLENINSETNTLENSKENLEIMEIPLD